MESNGALGEKDGEYVNSRVGRGGVVEEDVFSVATIVEIFVVGGVGGSTVKLVQVETGHFSSV